jgi:hypothetical protein
MMPARRSLDSGIDRGKRNAAAAAGHVDLGCRGSSLG